jgi:hypothetical protein
VGLEPLGKQPITLPDPKTMLFVYHDKAETLELDRILKQGMGAHQQLQLSIGKIL